MHNAPAVSFPVGRSRFYAAVVVGVLSLSASTLVLWATQADALVLRHLIAALLWSISAAGAVRTWRQAAVGVLHWDGQVWTWRCGDDGKHLDRVVDVAVVLDGQSALILRLSAQTRPIWVWPEQRMAPLHWLALRRAVFAPQPSAASQDVFGAAP
jgi:hypothetical protein